MIFGKEWTVEAVKKLFQNTQLFPDERVEVGQFLSIHVDEHILHELSFAGLRAGKGIPKICWELLSTTEGNNRL